MKKLEKQVIELMEIVSPSGQEQPVRDYLQPILNETFGEQNVWVDSYGNLLAEGTYGTGEGATVTLSSHMDSVKNYVEGRKIVNNNGILTATAGICGADDKAGLAIILATLRNVPSSFNGKIKIAFFVEEEIGCVGSSNAAKNETKEWLGQSDLAIVVDRRGNRDIVVGNFGQVFCSNAVGEFFEEASAMQEMDWKCVEGGISDTGSFADLNVNGVNLSAGYRNEHTASEWVSLADMQDTVKLIVQSLAIVNHHVDKFGDVPTENKWIDFTYSYGSYSYGSKWKKWSWEDEENYDGFYGHSSSTSTFRERDLALTPSVFGAVEITDIGGCLSITQGKGKNQQEILISQTDLEDLIIQYYDSIYRTQTAKDIADVKGGKLTADETAVDLDKKSKEVTEEQLPF